MSATKITCPHCGKASAQARNDGATDGPREYHAECWVAASEKMTDAEIKQAWQNSPIAD